MNNLLPAATRSFDVFDTLLTRAVGLPVSLFLLLGRELAAADQITVAPEEFVRRRVGAERSVCARDGGSEGTLAEICAELARTLGGDAALTAELIEREMALEARFLRPAPGASAMVAAARAESPRLLFVSDMYLPAEFIRNQLERHGFWQEGDGLYVSCEHGCSKRDGRLFKKVLAGERLQPSALLHTGDNGHGDVRGARRAGVRARHVTGCHLNGHETLLETFATDTGGAASLLAGAGRLARLSHDFGNDHRNRLRDVTAGVAAPLLTAFVGWLLARAAERGVKRLYFISRDGFVLKELAERMHPGIELRYLYGSRQAWHGPALETLDERACGWIFEATAVRSVRVICKRMGAAPDPLADLLAGWGFPPERWDEPLGEDDLQRLRDGMRDNAGVLARLRPVRAATRALAERYLEQEGLTDGVPAALVDLGWTGRLQDSLARLLPADRPPLLGFYFALKATATADGGPAGDKEAFLCDGRRADEAPVYIPDMFQVMESFCTAPHGSVAGYRAEGPGGGGVQPVFRDGAETALARWGLGAVHDTLRSFGDHLSAALPAPADWARCRPMALGVLQDFACHPAPAEAAAWGAFPYEDDQAGLHAEPFAKPLRPSVAALVGGFREGFLARPSPAAWIGGSKALTPRPALVLLRGASALGKLRLAAAKQLRRRGPKRTLPAIAAVGV